MKSIIDKNVSADYNLINSLTPEQYGCRNNLFITLVLLELLNHIANIDDYRHSVDIIAIDFTTKFDLYLQHFMAYVAKFNHRMNFICITVISLTI